MEGDTLFKWLWLSQEVRHCRTTYCKWRPNPPARSATWKYRKLFVDSSSFFSRHLQKGVAKWASQEQCTKYSSVTLH